MEKERGRRKSERINRATYSLEDRPLVKFEDREDVVERFEILRKLEKAKEIANGKI